MIRNLLERAQNLIRELNEKSIQLEVISELITIRNVKPKLTKCSCGLSSCLDESERCLKFS